MNRVTSRQKADNFGVISKNKVSNPVKTFTQSKEEFDKKYQKETHIAQSIVPVDGKIINNIKLKNGNGERLEEYYKWQFIHSLVNSGLVFKDYIGAEIYFPKGNKNAAPLKVDACIFDDKDWITHYQRWRQNGDEVALGFLRQHCLAVIEFKRGKDSLEKVFSSQLRPAMKEPDITSVLGFIYDMERLYIFHRQDNKILRYDIMKNRGDEGNQEISLSHTDSYLSIPSLDEIVSNINKSSIIDRTNRSVFDLDVITSRSSIQVKEALNKILRTLDNHNLDEQRGYEILIQTLTLKIFDEKRNIKDKNIPLKFYIIPSECNFNKLHDTNVQNFIERMRLIYDEAEGQYYNILKENHINWKNESHVRVVQSILENFQDFSLVRSDHTDLYQLVFYNFAHHFQKIQKAQFLTPIPIIEFVVKIVNPRGNETVFDPCLGIGDFLSLSYVYSNPRLDDQNLYGVDISDAMVALAQLNMLLNGDGKSKLFKAGDKGSIIHKVAISGNLVTLDPKLHKLNEQTKVVDWDNWHDATKLQKFDVILTNPPFGKGRTFEVKTQDDRDIMEMYETYWEKKKPNSLDKGVIFLENAYHVLAENGRLGIILSNAIASEEQFIPVMKWLIKKMRIVGIFDLPANSFAETTANTTIIVAYKPSEKELERLKNQNYSIFDKNVLKRGYDKKTKKRNVIFDTLYKINPSTFEVEIDQDGESVIDEEFSDIVGDFKEWARGQEETLQRLFVL